MKHSFKLRILTLALSLLMVFACFSGFAADDADKDADTTAEADAEEAEETEEEAVETEAGPITVAIWVDSTGARAAAEALMEAEDISAFYYNRVILACNALDARFIGSDRTRRYLPLTVEAGASISDAVQALYDKFPFYHITFDENGDPFEIAGLQNGQACFAEYDAETEGAWVYGVNRMPSLEDYAADVELKDGDRIDLRYTFINGWPEGDIDGYVR